MRGVRHIRGFFQHIKFFFAGHTGRVVVAVVLLVGAVYLLSRNMYYLPPEEERSAAFHQWFKKGFSVAIVWPPHGDLSLVEGVTLAHEELDASKSPLAGKIHLRVYSETADRGELAFQVVKIPDVLAVIGHELSGNAVPASLAYEEHGVLYISPKATEIRLAHHNFQYVFRLTPDDAEITRAIAQFAAQETPPWKRMGVLYGRIDHGEAASGQFVTAAQRQKITLTFFRSYLEQDNWQIQDFRPLISEIRGLTYDAIFLADQLPLAAKLLIDLARMGVVQPVIATDKLDSLDVWTIAQKASNNLYVASAVDPSSTNPAYVAFRERFRKRFHADPGYGASQGYEAFTVFVNACLQSQSADPIIVAATLKTNKWKGLFGDFSFDENGDVVGRDISIKQMHDGQFMTVKNEAVVPEEDTAAPEDAVAPDDALAPEDAPAPAGEPPQEPPQKQGKKEPK